MDIVKIESHWFWGTSIYLVADDGHALLKLVFDDSRKQVCVAYDLNTHPDCQGKGYADRLMDEAENVARLQGCCKILLWVEKESWQEAWYRRRGFADEEFLQPPADGTLWLEKFLNTDSETDTYFRQMEASIRKIAGENPSTKIVVTTEGKTRQQIDFIVSCAGKYGLQATLQSLDSELKRLLEEEQA